jgi:hypothetical protein
MSLMHRDAENFMKETMVYDHADKGSGGQQRIDLTKRALVDPGFNIGRQVIVQHAMVFAEEHVGQLMALECAKKK